MYIRAVYRILYILFITPLIFAQTNVGGNITTNQTWTLSGSPYSVISTLTIRDGAILTIENGVEVLFSSSYGINVGYSSSSSGNFIANGATFRSTYSSDSKINIKYTSSSGSFHTCTFDNVYLDIDDAQVDFNFTVFFNCNYPILIENEGKISGMFLFGPDNLHKGIERTGTISHNFRLIDHKVPYFINDLTVKDGATLTIDDSVDIQFSGTTGIYVGYSATSTGNIKANNVRFTGLSSSDAQIYFRANSTGNITNCTFNNSFLNVDNSSPEIRYCEFTKCVNAIYVRNNASPIIENNDFFNNITALKNTGTNTVIAENNYWGHLTGPQHINNPSGLGQEIVGSVDFQPFYQLPVNGSIQPEFTVNVIEVADTRVGSYKETEINFLISKGSIDLLVTDIQCDLDVFTINSRKTFWLSSGDTAKIKIRFTPRSAIDYVGNLLIYSNLPSDLPLAIPIKGHGTSYLTLSSDTLNFGKVDLKDYKSINLKLKNGSASSIRIDSIVSTNPNFNYVLGAYPLEVNEDLFLTELSSITKNRSSISTSTGFYIPGKDSENVLITFKPISISSETGFLKIYYNNNGIETVNLTGEGYSAPISVKITGINFQNFPFIYLNAIAENYGVPVQTLTKSNFRIYENGILQASHFNVTQPGESRGSRLADIIFIMDNSGSLQNERDAVAQNVSAFVNNLSSSGIDYALGLCRYGSSNSGGLPIIEDDGVLTSDVDYFKSNVWTRNQTGGGTEPGYLAIKQSASDFAFRPGAQKIFIIITDETPKQGTGTLNDALSLCMNNSITLFALTYADLYFLFTPVTDATHGSVYDIRSDFNEILAYISNTVSSAYVLEYSSSSSESDNIFREVVVKIDYQGFTNADTIYYNPLSLPRITRTNPTKQIHDKAWTQGTSFNIQAIITDEYEPFVKYARIYFRKTGDSLYHFITMSNSGIDLYSATIPYNYVQPPGVDYYITASDSISTTSDPKTNPGLNPYQIAILPNVAPVISHIPVGFAQLNTAIKIDATIDDNTNFLKSARLYFRKTGQLSFQNIVMNNIGTNNYSTSIPEIWNTRDGLEYYIRAIDDFNVSNYHGTYDSPHKISTASIVLNAQIDTLTIGPSIRNVIVPSNGAGYCYFDFRYQNNPITSGSIITIKLWNQNYLYESEGFFIKPGILRIKIPSDIVVDSFAVFSIANQISVGDTLFNLETSPFQIKAVKIQSEFTRSWDVFASESAGVSGSVGSAGVGASASAAKLSVKGTAGAGLKIERDQDEIISLDRRIEVSLAVGLEVPQLNAVGAKATVSTASITVKALVGQEFSFSDINLSEDTKKMAQAGFLLETFSIAGIGLSPVVGPILQAIINVLNTSAGINSTFDKAQISNYWGTGLEGSIGAGFNIKAQSYTMNAINGSSTIALNLKFIDYFRKANKRLKKLSSLTNYSSHSIELDQAVSFNFSTLDFGLKADDDVELQSGNFGLFDAGIGSDISTTAKFDSLLHFAGLNVSLTGGGGITGSLFGGSMNRYYKTEIEFPKEYGQVFTTVGSALAGFITSQNSIPLGSDLVNVTVQSLKDAYNNIKPVPVKITTFEKRGKGESLDFSIDLDLALLLGVGVSLGVSAKYYDELEFPKKVSNIYLNGNNFLLYTSNYSSDMQGDNFTDVVENLLSGTLPLVKQAFTNILNTVTEIVVAGKKFIISAITQTGDAVGGIVGEAEEAGSWVVTTFSSWLPMTFQKQQFEKPIFKKMYSSTRVMHPDNTKTPNLSAVDSKLILVSESMVVNFYKTGSNKSEKTVENPYQIKMLIKDNKLLDNFFTANDKEKVKLYYYDDELLNWLLVGGTRNADTVTANVNKLGTFALGIEVSGINDTKSPKILEFGPVSGSTFTSFPEIYMVVKDEEYGSGLDLSRTYIILNGDTLDFSFDPSASRIYYQLSDNDSLKTSNLNVKIICSDFTGNISEENSEFTLNVTGVVKQNDIPDKFNLLQNYPNPFNPSTTIRFDIPKKTNVEINIYDIRGSFVTTLFSGELTPGHHSIIWKGVDNYNRLVASGIYFYQIKANEFNAVRKMQLIK
jgi:hypothetical protein